MRIDPIIAQNFLKSMWGFYTYFLLKKDTLRGLRCV